MSEIKIYGIPNCNSVKKTFDWCKKNKIEFEFHNYKKEGIEISKLKNWCKLTDWKMLFNTKGTTWKIISEQYSNKNISEKEAIAIMLEHNSIIKRPVIEYMNKLLVGYDEDMFNSFLKK